VRLSQKLGAMWTLRNRSINGCDTLHEMYSRDLVLPRLDKRNMYIRNLF
jgi:hypothetical protein